MPDTCQYVIQHHTGYGADHFDLMLQRDQSLWTWRLDRLPPAEPEAAVPAVRIADHRLAYLTYEGPITRGAGRCRIIDRGRVTWRQVQPDRIVVELAAGQVEGVFELASGRGQDGNPVQDQWELRRSEDQNKSDYPSPCGRG